jgi:hypothetical protein
MIKNTMSKFKKKSAQKLLFVSVAVCGIAYAIILVKLTDYAVLASQ